MAEIKLSVAKREKTPGSGLRKLRSEGKVPGIYYGTGETNIPITADYLELRKLIYTSESHIINLNIEGSDEELSCIMKDVQFHPVKDNPIHFDLIALHKGQRIKIEVTLHLIGTAPGVKEGGVLQHSFHKLDVECLPKDIPSHIDIDISKLNIGDSIKVSELNLENVTILNDENTVLASVVAPKAEVEEEPTEEDENAEPEVIGKGKSDEDGEEGKDDKEEKGE
jgi:large subunit ribosomal protein L25